MLTKEEYFNFMIKHGCNPINWRAKTEREFVELTKNQEKEIKQWHKELNNTLSKRYRIKEKIKKYNEIYFITLTIDNEHIKNKKETFERKLKEIFKNTNYIANEDFGKINERLHYHILSEENINLDKWIYGFTSKFKTNQDTKDITRLSCYITKLANHTIKKGTGKIIYGRKKKQMEKNN